MRVVVSLTSTPSRVRHVEATLRSLLEQTYPFDVLYLWLPRTLARTGERLDTVPESLLSLQAEQPRLHVRFLAVDLGPASKLVPTLELETAPQTLIFYCDDDVRYGREVLSTLVEWSACWPDAALGPCLFDLNRNNAKHTSSGQPYFGHRPVRTHGGCGEFIEGYGGVLVRRQFFGPLFGELFPPLLSDAGADPTWHPSFSDDVVISCYLRARGIALRAVRQPDCAMDSIALLEHGDRSDALRFQGGEGSPVGGLVRYTALLPRIEAEAARLVAAEQSLGKNWVHAPGERGVMVQAPWDEVSEQALAH